jgi:putative inorganic carbon (HCO3(-)) transporter
MMQYMGFEPIWPKVLNPFGGRSVSTFGNPNFLSSYLVMVILAAMACFLSAAKGAARKWYYALTLIAFAAELCTLTRSSWLGLGAGMVLFGSLLWFFERELVVKNKKVIAVSAALFIAIGVFFPQSTVGGKNPTIIERLTEAARATKEKKNYGSVNQRQLIWSCAASMVLEKPILGKGWGCFELFYPFYQGKFLFLEPFREFRTHANNAHDEILEIWSQTGTLGFGVYLWFLACLYYYALYLMKNLKGPPRVMVIGITSA